MKRVLFAIALLLATAVTLAAPPVISITAAPTSGKAPLPVTLSWSVQGAVSCTGTGAWSGTKNVAGGSQAVTVSASASYGLICVAADGSATVSWTPPVKNTDGSTLTDLAGFKVLFGSSASSLTQSVTLADPAATAKDIGSLTSGTWYFGVRAVNSKGVESDTAPAATPKTIVGSTATASASVTIDTIPNPPSNVIVTVAPVVGANMTPVYRFNGSQRTSDVLGFVATGVPCRGPVRFRYHEKSHREVSSAAVVWYRDIQPVSRAAAACS